MKLDSFGYYTSYQVAFTPQLADPLNMFLEWTEADWLGWEGEGVDSGDCPESADLEVCLTTRTLTLRAEEEVVGFSVTHPWRKPIGDYFEPQRVKRQHVWASPYAFEVVDAEDESPILALVGCPLVCLPLQGFAAMDNLTHSIAGMLLAEAALQRATRQGHAAPRGLIYAASICANNLPDLDFVLTPLTEGKLGYLLHHRGHTHTVLIGLVMALSQAAIASMWLRRRGRTDWAVTGRLVAFTSCVGVIVHLLLDFGNNYGVHPFWPVDSRWFYGDTTFIIEPWWWSFGGAALFPLMHSRVAKGVQLVIWALGAGMAWLLPLPLEAGIYGSVLGALSISTMLLRLSRPRRLLFAFGLLAVFYSGQVWARSQATKQVSAALASEPLLHVVDLVQTPFPSAPWCWDIIVVALETHDGQHTYVLRLARATALSGLRADHCPLMRPATTAPLRAVTSHPEHRVHWDGEYRLSGEAFARLARSCWGQAFLRFARVPFVAGERSIVGDLRFDRAQEIEFTELQLPELATECPRWVPGWEAPRQDVMNAVGGW